MSKEIKAMSKEDFMASIDQIENQPNLAPADDMSTEDIFALVAFIGALLAIVGTVIPFIGFLGWLAALIFGFLGLKSEKWQWMAIVGVVVGLLILLLVILLLIFVLLLGASIGAW